MGATPATHRPPGVQRPARRPPQNRARSHCGVGARREGDKANATFPMGVFKHNSGGICAPRVRKAEGKRDTHPSVARDASMRSNRVQEPRCTAREVAACAMRGSLPGATRGQACARALAASSLHEVLRQATTAISTTCGVRVAEVGDSSGRTAAPLDVSNYIDNSTCTTRFDSLMLAAENTAGRPKARVCSKEREGALLRSRGRWLGSPVRFRRAGPRATGAAHPRQWSRREARFSGRQPRRPL